MGVPIVQPSEVALATGGFHSLAEIGEGGFGKVYRAMVHNRPVAIKVMAEGGLQGQAEFDTEQQLLARLSHGHLVRLLGVVRSAQPPLRCLLYELMPGGNVEEQLASEGGRRVLPWWLRLRVAAQVSAAVAYLHGLPASAGGPLVHRDIKPANWFLDGRLNAKLGDMGLALPLSEAEAASRRRGGAADREQAMVGTWQYMPPEYRSSGVIDLKGDVYALGVSLLQLATGQLERLAELLPRCREALAGGGGSSLLDPKAGAWDQAAGERLLCLGLWCCQDAPEGRPSSQTVADQLAKLWLATDEALKAAAAAAAGAAEGGAGWTSGRQQGGHEQQQSTGARQQQQQHQHQQQLPPQQQQHVPVTASSSTQGGGGSFWRFLTGGTQ